MTFNRINLLKKIITDKDAVIKHYEKRIFDLETRLKEWQKLKKGDEE